MSILDKIFKKNKSFKYEDNNFLVEFRQDIIKIKEDEETNQINKSYVNYVNAKDISPDLKVRGTKYYKGNTIGSDIKFTVYLRVRYDKSGREYVKEPLITQLGSISDNARTNDALNITDYADGPVATTIKVDICDINVYDILNGHLDYVLEDIVLDETTGKNRICTYFSFKHMKDKNGKDVEGYLAFDSKTADSKYINYLKQMAISSSTN